MSLFRKTQSNKPSQLDIEKELFERELALYRKEKYQKLSVQL